jgi:hypothetical protein
MSEKVDVMRQYYLNTFGCDVNQVTYDLLKSVGNVYMPEGNCTDMDSTINFFTAQIPSISHIITWCAGNLDTQYIIHEGEWVAI